MTEASDSVEGIRQIKQEFIVGPLSSGNTALLVDMAKAAGLPWDVTATSVTGLARQLLDEP